jgi:hypothetical protein
MYISLIKKIDFGAIVVRRWTNSSRQLVNFISTLRFHPVDSTSSRIRYTRRVPLAHAFTNIEQSGSLLNLHFQQSDLTYDWMLAYLVSKALCPKNRLTILLSSALKMPSKIPMNSQPLLNNRI